MRIDGGAGSGALKWILAALAISRPMVANAAVFDCKSGSYWDDAKPVFLRLTGGDDGIFGTVEVQGVKSDARYELVGVNRRWDWGFSDRVKGYAIVLKPDNTAVFVDFSQADEDGRANPSEFFVCRAVSA